jgi:outer membrane receptor protein involved in Fe transport
VETGDVLPGANVILEGTSLGAASDVEGRYFILNVPVGEYSIRAEVIGYKAHTITGILVTIDHTTTVDFDMETTVLAGEEVTVTAVRPLIQMDNTATRTFITADQITGVAAETITELVTMEAGSVGANVRGGRASGTVYYIDGISLRNPFVGYEGQTMGTFRGGGTSGYAPDNSLGVELPEFAFSEVEMLTGGYSPEFGNATDAVVNIATKEGRSEHTGFLRITTEGMFMADQNGIEDWDWYIDPSLHLPPDEVIDDVYIVDEDGYGYSAGDTVGTPRTVNVQGGRLLINNELVDQDGIQDIHDSSVLDNVGREYIESTPIWTETRNNYDRTHVAYSFSGPLFQNAYYAVSGEWQDQTQGRYTNQHRKDFSLLAKLTYNISQRLYYQLNRKWQGGYLPGFGPIAKSFETVNDRFKKDFIFSGVLTQSLGPNAYINFTFGMYNSDFEQKRKDYDDRDGDGDTDEYLVFRKITVPRNEPGTAAYTDTSLWRYTTEDEELLYIWTQDPSLVDSVNYPNSYDPNYRGEWKIGNEDVVANDHMWSLNNKSGWKEIWIPVYDADDESWSYYSDWLFVTGDNEFEETGASHNDLDERVFNVTDANFKAVGDPYRPYLRTESKITTFKVDYANQATPIHFLQAGGELMLYDMYAMRINTSSISNFYLDEWDRNPYEWSMYFRDKIEMGGMILTGGLRLDSYNLGKDLTYSAVADDPAQFPVNQETGEIEEPVEWSDPKIYVSPRLGISHPITERDVLHFSYNHFLQRPDWIYFYQNLNYSDEGAFPPIGNPELEPQRTVSYEVGFTHQFTENMKVDVTAYYKDIFGWVQLSRGGELPGTKFRIPTNADFGNVKGFEVALDKRYSNYFLADVNYTFMIANGRLSDPGLGGTYLWRQFVMPRSIHPLDYDQTHTLNVNVNIFVPPNKNPFLLFGNWRVNVTNRYGSGLPFDSQSRNQAYIIPAENDERRPFTNTVDMRIEKRVNVGSGYASVWVDVFNLLNKINLGDEPDNAEWYLSQEDLDGNGVADHANDPEGRYHDWTVWNAGRRIKVGIDVSF